MEIQPVKTCRKQQRYIKRTFSAKGRRYSNKEPNLITQGDRNRTNKAHS